MPFQCTHPCIHTALNEAAGTPGGAGRRRDAVKEQHGRRARPSGVRDRTPLRVPFGSNTRRGSTRRGAARLGGSVQTNEISEGTSL